MRLRLTTLVALLGLVGCGIEASDNDPINTMCDAQNGDAVFVDGAPGCWILNGKNPETVRAAYENSKQELYNFGVNWDKHLALWTFEVRPVEWWESQITPGAMAYGVCYPNAKFIQVNVDLSSLCHEMLESRWPGFHRQGSSNYGHVTDTKCTNKSFP